MWTWRVWAILNGALTISIIAGGCRTSRQVRDQEYVGVVSATVQAAENPAPAIAAVPPVAQMLAGPQPVEVYIQYALAQNPEIQSARKRVDALASRVPQAASLDDPMLSVMGYPFYPAVPQTAAGRGTVSIAASQQVPWFGKLQTKADAAEAETNAARAQLAAAELAVIEQVKARLLRVVFPATGEPHYRTRSGTAVGSGADCRSAL